MINQNMTTQTSVEAADYSLLNGFFWFDDEEGNTVLTYAADKVVSIRRKD